MGRLRKGNHMANDAICQLSEILRRAMYAVQFAIIDRYLFCSLLYRAGLGGTFHAGPHRSGRPSLLAWDFISTAQCLSRSAVPQPTTCAWWSDHHRSEIVLQLMLQSCSW